MIRSNQVPSVLTRICGNGISAVALVTGDGELLGTSYRKPCEMLSNQSTLLTEIASDYVRLGVELRQQSLSFLCFELDQGTVGIATAGPDFVVAICDLGTPLGMIKGRLLACALYIQESLAPSIETTGALLLGGSL